MHYDGLELGACDYCDLTVDDVDVCTMVIGRCDRCAEVHPIGFVHIHCLANWIALLPEDEQPLRAAQANLN